MAADRLCDGNLDCPGGEDEMLPECNIGQHSFCEIVEEGMHTMGTIFATLKHISYFYVY